MKTATAAVGALDGEERAILATRDGYREQFRRAKTDGERARWLRAIEETVRRYDRLRSKKWEMGEIK